MTTLTEHLIKDSDNLISLTLTEGGNPIAGAWTELRIHIGDPPLLTITRNVNSNGVNFTGGVLQIQPGALTENLAPLIEQRVYPVHIVVTSASNPNGVDFGAGDTDTRLFFQVWERPA